MTDMQTLKLDQLRIDGGTQPRVAIDEQVVAEYAALYTNGVDLPPVTVFFDGAAYWLADGFHRYWANRKIECKYVFADIRQGTQRDAILYSVGANADHGLRRGNEDKRKAIRTLLRDEEWGKWSNREIARRCGVSDKTVAVVREIHTAEIPQYESTERTFTHSKTGKPTTMKTSKIGGSMPKRKKPKSDAISPNAFPVIHEHTKHVPKRAMELPHNPHSAAMALLSAFGHDFAQALAREITTYLEGLES